MAPSYPNLSSSSPPPDLHMNRRRSQSRTSSSSFRTSLGGKLIGQKYTGSSSSSSITSTSIAAAARRFENASNGSGNSQGHGGSEISVADSESIAASAGGLENSLMAKFGSYSATREELRDGSARLASLSLSQPSPLPSPNLTKSTSTTPPQFPILSPTSSPFSPPSTTSKTTRAHSIGIPGPSNAQPSSIHALKPSPSNLSLARPLNLSSNSKNDASPTTADGSSGSEDITPTQSKMGSLVPQHRIEGDASPDSLLTSRTPIPTKSLRLDLEEGEEEEEEGSKKERSMTRRRKRKVKVLGDEIGGTDSEDNEGGDEDDGLSPDSSPPRPLFGNEATERTPLLNGEGMRRRRSIANVVPKHENRFITSASMAITDRATTLLSTARNVKITRDQLSNGFKDSLTALPAVILGVLMNILDGVSYGMIMFPTNLPRFSNFGGIGVSMFFVSCVISQLVYSGGGSIFKGGNGSMMIEVVPFFHSIVMIIQNHLSDDKDLVATTMIAFALSSILTGIAFGALGVLKLGSLSEFFPRHILVGCIGGVGAFLFITGLQVSARLEDVEGFSLDLLRHYFDSDVLPLWAIPLILAIVLRLITSRYHHPLIFPGYFLSIPLIFYAIALSVGVSVNDLRQQGWVFELKGVDSQWYEYWTLFDLRKTDWSALIETIPTQLALVFFGLLHVPINVPALGISVGEDNVNTDRELVAHGISNIAAGLFGTVPNYLCYVNSVLFYKVGGTTRLSGFLLAGASFGVLLAGPGVIGYLPVCVVGALIFILGIDLVKEAVWDTYGRVARLEYLTIWAIIAVMTIWDFVAGIGAGIILASVSFVVSSSQRRAIRAILTGAVARSTVRRHPKQSAFLKAVGKQTRVIKLQGFLFFGTISSCEATIRKILEAASWSKNPIRFLVLDFSMASGVDFSAAEAFVRIQRLLDERGVLLVFCGCALDSSVGIALRSVDLWAEGPDPKVEVFENLNDALEFCENAYLRSLYSKNFEQPHRVNDPTPALSSQIDVPKSELDSDVETVENSPRASHLRSAAKKTMVRSDAPPAKSNLKQPLPLLMQSLKPFDSAFDQDYCYRLVPYFKRMHVERGTVLWTNGSESDSFYLIESGILRANYVFLDRAHAIVESMVAGTIAGEMSFLSRSKRNATVTAERDSILWKLDVKSHEEMGKREGWAFTRQLEACLLRIACEEQDVLMGHLISSL